MTQFRARRRNVAKGSYIVSNKIRHGNVKNQCTGKVKYRKRDAIGKALEARRRGRNRLMRVYFCDLCDFWHIAHSRYGEGGISGLR